MALRRESDRNPLFLEELRAQVWQALEDDLDAADGDAALEPASTSRLHPGNSETERQLELLFVHVHSEESG